MRSKGMAGWAALGLAFTAGNAAATNAPFQAYFFNVCASPTGALATRCGETTGGLGNISGDSESSLNPSQALGQNRPLVGSAQGRADEARQRGADLSGDGDTSGTRVDMGRFALLINLRGSWYERGKGTTTVAERSVDGDSKAAEIGFDYRASDTVVLGALVGLERSEHDFGAVEPGVNFVPASTAGGGKVDETYLTGFASLALGDNGFLDISGGYGRVDGTYTRNSVFQEATRTTPQVNSRVAGDSNGSVTWLGVNAGLDFVRDAFAFGPYAGVTYTDTQLDGYLERDVNGAGLAMRFSDTSRSSLLGHAGLRAGNTFSSGAGVFVPQLRVEYQYEFDDDPQSVTSAYLLDAGGNSFTLVGDQPDRSAVNASLSLSAVFANGWNAFVDYSMLLSNSDFERNRLTIGVRVEF